MTVRKVPAPSFNKRSPLIKADESEEERPALMLGSIVQLNDKPAPRKGQKKRPIWFTAKADEPEES